MKFAVSTTKLFYDSREEIERLAGLGFTFQPVAPNPRHAGRSLPMRIAGHPMVTLSTMDALLDFARDHGGRVALDMAENEIVLLNG